MSSSYNVVESHGLQQKISGLISYHVLSSLQDIVRLESWGRKEGRGMTLFPLLSIPSPRPRDAFLQMSR